MASFQNMDNGTKSLIDRSFPATKEAGEDAVKISGLAFPDAEVVHLIAHEG